MLNKDAKIDLKCPHCNRKFSRTVRQLLSGNPVTCPACGKKVDTTAARDGLTKTEKSLQDIKKRNSKNIKIDFNF